MAVDRLDDDTIRSTAPDADAPDETPELSDSSGDMDNPEASDNRAKPTRDHTGRADVQAEYRAYAIEQGCERVQETEETSVTPAMRRIEAEDADRHLVGLEHRLKGRDRIEEKVLKAMSERSLTAEKAFAETKDAIRYTFQYPEGKYSEGVRADVRRLADDV